MQPFRIPFIRPRLPSLADFAPLLRHIELSGRATNFGPNVAALEAEVVQAHFQGEGAAVTVCNATLGLMLAMIESKRAGGRLALMPSFTFAATPLAAQWCGLQPYFVDVEPGTWCVQASRMGALAQQLGEAVAVVVPYATFGTDLPLHEYSQMQAAGLPVVVDAAPGFGTTLEQVQFGHGFGGTVVFSLHATKTFATGEGGLIYTGDHERAQRLRRLSNFGFGPERVCLAQGLNAKLSEYAAAVALAALRNLPAHLRERQAIAQLYRRSMEQRGLLTAGWELQAARGCVALQSMSALVPASQDAAPVARRLADKGIEVRTYFNPACHTQPQFASAPRTEMTITDELCRRILSLPLWIGMGVSEVDEIVERIAVGFPGESDAQPKRRIATA